MFNNDYDIHLIIFIIALLIYIIFNKNNNTFA